ncbi:MAG: glycogen/starch synthase [Bacteroidetes bacterium]|nr:glycogen/starch synthase [Bacteroidota bacterium]
MMKKKKVLFISQEITPYLEESELSNAGRFLPQGIQEAGKEIRTFMPKFGCINERRNQLHEVIRLSGMNLIINDTDHPLIIKVGSIQPARMQVYFIDSEDFFNRKGTTHCHETKKHCHGWMTSLVPLYIKTSYSKDPIFENSKVVYSIYNNNFDKTLNQNFADKAMMDGISDEHVADYKKTSFVDINKAAMNLSDAVVMGCEKIHPELEDYFNTIDKPKLNYHDAESFVQAHSEFYDEILESVLQD